MPSAICTKQTTARIVATGGTARSIERVGVKPEHVQKATEGRPNIVDRLRNGEIAMVFNTTEGAQAASRFESATLSHETLLNRDVAEGRGWSVGLSVSDTSKNSAGNEKGSLAGSSVGFARINNQVVHQQAFYDAFECKAGDKMYLEPKSRVKVW